MSASGRSGRGPAVVFSLGVACASLALTPAPKTSLHWPLEVPGVLLASFGEYRYDHLHAGIDISTEGGTGYKVLAADRGVVYRLKVEWRGYGRALYLRHPNGRVTVYGHLERYEDAVLGLERRVARRQAEAGTRYPGDIYIDPPLPVRRGQVIAYSGESGVGLPHLHFEVRERDDQPIDPFVAGLPRPADHRPPVLESITLTSAAPGTFIDGSDRERTVSLVNRGRGAPGKTLISGEFLAAVSAYDPVGASGRAGVRLVEARLDGRSIYNLEFRSFRFDQYPQSGLIYDHTRSHLTPSRYAYRLLRLPGNDLADAIDRPTANDGDRRLSLNAQPGPHRLDVTVADEAGNRTRAGLDFIMTAAAATPADPVRPPAAMAGAHAGGAASTFAWPFFLEVLLAGVPGEIPPLSLRATESGAMLAGVRMEDGAPRITLNYAQAEPFDGLTIADARDAGEELTRIELSGRLVRRSEGGALRLGRFAVEVPPNGRFFDGPLLARGAAVEAPAGLVAAGDALELLPAGEALDQPATLRVRLDDEQAAQSRRLAIYRFDSETGRWSCEGGEVDSSGRALTLRFRRYGRFALMSDMAAPVLGEIRPVQGARVSGHQPRISARVEDVGMGLNFDGVAFLLDGAPLESEFDPDRGLSQVISGPTLTPGPHSLRVTATDRAGNSSAPAEISFEVR